MAGKGKKGKAKDAKAENLIEVEITPQEREARRLRLEEVCDELDHIEDEYSQKRRGYNKQIKGLKGEMAALVKVLRTGREMVEHPSLPMNG